MDYENMAQRALNGIREVAWPQEKKAQLLQLRESGRAVLPKQSEALGEIERLLADLTEIPGPKRGGLLSVILRH